MAIQNSLYGTLTQAVRNLKPLGMAVSLSVIVGLGAILSIRSNQLLRDDRERVMHSLEVMRAADRVLVATLDAETGQRGYIITTDPAFLAPYEDAVTRLIPENLGTLKVLVADNPIQLAALDKFKALADQKVIELRKTLLVLKEQGPEAARLLVANREGKTVMDGLRSLANSMQSNEAALLATRSARIAADEQRIIWTIVLTTTLTTAIRLLFATRRQGA